MTLELTALMGVIATVISTSILIPSVIWQIRHKSAGKTDITILAQVALANLSWVVYALMDGDVYVLGRALIAGVISALSIYLYYKYRGSAK